MQRAVKSSRRDIPRVNYNLNLASARSLKGVEPFTVMEGNEEHGGDAEAGSDDLVGSEPEDSTQGHEGLVRKPVMSSTPAATPFYHDDYSQICKLTDMDGRTSDDVLDQIIEFDTKRIRLINDLRKAQPEGLEAEYKALRKLRSDIGRFQDTFPVLATQDRQDLTKIVKDVEETLHSVVQYLTDNKLKVKKDQGNLVSNGYGTDQETEKTGIGKGQPYGPSTIKVTAEIHDQTEFGEVTNQSEDQSLAGSLLSAVKDTFMGKKVVTEKETHPNVQSLTNKVRNLRRTISEMTAAQKKMETQMLKFAKHGEAELEVSLVKDDLKQYINEVLAEALTSKGRSEDTEDVDDFEQEVIREIPQEKGSTPRREISSVLKLGTGKPILNRRIHFQEETSPQVVNVPDQDSNTQVSRYEKMVTSKIKSCVSILNEFTNSLASSVTTKADVLAMHSTVKPEVEFHVKQLSKMEDDYVKNCEGDFLDRVIQETYHKANNWKADLHQTYLSYHLHLQGEKKNFTEVKLAEFNGDPGGITVYEFFDLFHRMTENCDPGEKADVLHSNYLAQNLKDEVESVKRDVRRMEDYLVLKYGDLRTVVDSKALALKLREHPNRSKASNVLYFKFFFQQLEQLESLASSARVNKAELQGLIYSSNYVRSIVCCMPKMFQNQYSKSCYRKDKQFAKVDGQTSFEILKSMCREQWVVAEDFQELEAIGAQQSERTKMRINVVLDEDDELETVKPVAEPELDIASLVATTLHSELNKILASQQLNIPGKQTKNRSNLTLLSTPPSNIIHPCPLDVHKIRPNQKDHEMGECDDFWAIPKKERGVLCKTKRLCFTCLKASCYTQSRQSCQSVKAIPTSLICLDCATSSPAANLRPRSVLLCLKDDHNKPDLSTLLKDLATFFKGFNSAKYAQPVKDTVLFISPSFCNCCEKTCLCVRPESKSSKVNPSELVPNFDTKTGEVIEDLEVLEVIREENEESVYIMQMFCIAGLEALGFYDTGASSNMVLGSFAETAQFKVLDSRNFSVGTVGARSIWTQYGVYSARIGPDMDGNMWEMSFQGIDKITDFCPRYDWQPAVEELEADGRCKGRKLPLYIGGMPVQLLIGIRSSTLTPRLLFSLPCGLGVFETMFFDQWGSNLAFGGASSLITKVNREFTNLTFPVINQVFSELTNSYMHSLLCDVDLRPNTGQGEDLDQLGDEDAGAIVLTMKTATGMTINPTPLTDEDIATQLWECPVDTGTEASYFGTSCCTCVVHKAKIPLAKLRTIDLEEDYERMVDFRCDKCADCDDCKASPRLKAISIQESKEQGLIRKVVWVDFVNKITYTKYPFLQDPVQFFTSRFGGRNNNYDQALKVYKTTCRKTDRAKEGIREAFAGIKEFLCKLEDLPEDLRKLINGAAIQHFFPWRPVENPSSQSTKHRLVVDPTMTGMNLILAKGENLMNKIHTILIRARTKRFVWTTDIKKLFNQLYLDESALSYSLFLFSDELDPDKVPDIYVMMRLWYGLISALNLAQEGINKAASAASSTYPEAAECLTESPYVDDVFDGAHTEEDRLKQCQDVKTVLESAGFTMKFLALSGHDPPEKASADGESIGTLGLKWKPKKDVFYLGLGEINFNKKYRGAKKDNPFEVKTKEDVARLLSTVPKLTRRICVGKVAEMFDTLGLWEPLKAEFKMDLARLNGLGWDAMVPVELEAKWKENFSHFVDLPFIGVKRCVVPEDAVNPYTLRLLCTSDAAVQCGGGAIYAGYPLKHGGWSCDLLTSKSKLLSKTIPKNELDACVITAELAYACVHGLGEIVKEVIFVTDSTIALCWVFNEARKLKIFTLNRVKAIRRFVSWCTGTQEIPLYHVDGTLNPADFLTKGGITLDMLGSGSVWQEGYPWMRKDLHDMQLTTYNDLKISTKDQADIDLECSPELYAEESAWAGSLEPANIKIHLVETVEQGMCDLSLAVEDRHCDTCIKEGARPWLECQGRVLEASHCSGCVEKGDTEGDQGETTDPNYFVSTPAIGGGVCKQMEGLKYVVDPIETGWAMSNKIVNIMMRFILKAFHSAHNSCKDPKLAASMLERCAMCKYNDQITKEQSSQQDKVNEMGQGILVTTRAQAKYSQTGDVYWDESVVTKRCTDHYWNKLATQEVKANQSQKQVEKFELHDSVLWFGGRLKHEDNVTSEDVDADAFYDGGTISFCSPVVMSTSAIFYSFAMFVHWFVMPHMGIESTLREILKRFHVINPRPVLSKMRGDCKKCRILIKKTAELEMAQHDRSRYTIAPPYYTCQLDLAQRFKAYPRLGSRQAIEVPAAVFVCQLTGACAAYILDDYSTQSVVMAVQRHSYRYGAPKKLFVDSGRQLIKLTDLKLNIRALSTGILDELGIQIVVSNPKAHNERGRVECRIKLLKDLMLKTAVETKVLTMIGWETALASVTNLLNNIPVARAGTSANLQRDSWNLLTPNRLILGFNNFRAIEGPVMITGAPDTMLEKIKLIQKTWYKLFLERIHTLIPQPKWFRGNDVQEGDIVLFLKEDSLLKNMEVWHYGRVVSLGSGKKKGTVTLGYYLGQNPEMKKLDRSVRDISVIHEVGSLDFNTVQHFEGITRPLAK